LLGGSYPSSAREEKGWASKWFTPRRDRAQHAAPLLRFLIVGFGVGAFDFAVAGGQPGADFLGIVVEGTVATAVGDFPFFIEDVEAFGPGGVRIVGGVVHVVDAEGNGIFEALGEIVGDGEAIGKIARLRVANVVLEVGFHLPLIGGVSFANIDGQKIGVFFIVVVQLDDVADLATEGRSSKTAEDED